MLNIIISGPPGSGKTWAAMFIRRALARHLGAGPIEISGEDHPAFDALEQTRLVQIRSGVKPLEGKPVRITQVRLNRDDRSPALAPVEVPDSLTEGYVLKHLASRLAHLGDDLNFLIGITPTGEKRNHLTDLNINLLSATDALKKVQAL